MTIDIIDLIDHAVKAGINAGPHRSGRWIRKEKNADGQDRNHQQYILDQILSLRVIHNAIITYSFAECLFVYLVSYRYKLINFNANELSFFGNLDIFTFNLHRPDFLHELGFIPNDR